jgi:hypothetical protein
MIHSESGLKILRRLASSSDAVGRSSRSNQRDNECGKEALTNVTI